MTMDLKAAYRTVMDDHFAPTLEISFVGEGKRQTLVYEKVAWTIDGVRKGLRYGENPGQEAAMYRLTNGNLAIGEVETIQPGAVAALAAAPRKSPLSLRSTSSSANVGRVQIAPSVAKSRNFWIIVFSPDRFPGRAGVFI